MHDSDNTHDDPEVLLKELDDVAATVVRCVRGKKSLLRMLFAGALKAEFAFREKLQRLVEVAFTGRERYEIEETANKAGIHDGPGIFVPALIQRYGIEQTDNLKTYDQMWDHIYQVAVHTGSNFPGIRTAPAFLEALDA